PQRARPGAAGDRRCGGRGAIPRERRQAGAGQPGDALRARPRLPRRQPRRRRRPRAGRVHPSRSPGPPTAERREFRRRHGAAQMTLMNALRPLVLMLVAAASSASLVAHQAAQPRPPAGPPAAGQAVRTKDIDATAVTAIVVDVVVRDRDGKPVTDLKPTDFELYEEKQLQEVGSFTPVNRPDPAAGPAAAAAATPTAAA